MSIGDDTCSTHHTCHAAVFIGAVRLKIQHTSVIPQQLIGDSECAEDQSKTGERSRCKFFFAETVEKPV